MSAIKRPSLGKLRRTSVEEILRAEEIAATRSTELAEMAGRIREMEEAYPSLCGMPGPGEEEMPEGLRGVYAAQTARYDALAKLLMQDYPLARQTALQRQQETRNKAGELVLSSSVAVFIHRIMATAALYVPAMQKNRFEEQAREVYADFLRENPGAVLARAGEQQEGIQG